MVLNNNNNAIIIIIWKQTLKYQIKNVIRNITIVIFYCKTTFKKAYIVVVIYIHWHTAAILVDKIKK